MCGIVLVRSGKLRDGVMHKADVLGPDVVDDRRRWGKERDGLGSTVAAETDVNHVFSFAAGIGVI